MTLARALALALPLTLALAACEEGEDDTTDTDTDPDGSDTDTDGSDTDTDDTDGSDTDTDTDGGDTDTDTDVSSYTWPASSSSYVFEDATVLTAIDIPDFDAMTPVDCCRDWGTDSRNGTGLDNALAGLVNALSGLLGDLDIEATANATIQSGSFVGLLEYRDLPVGDGTFPMAFHLGEWNTGTTWTDVDAGDGEFLVFPESFVGSSGTPQIVFGQSSITSDVLSATDGSFQITFPLLGANLTLVAEDTSITGDVTRTADGVFLEDAELSGYVPVNNVFSAINDAVDVLCGCAGLTGDLFSQQGPLWTGDCNNNVDQLCTLPDEEVCVTLINGNIGSGGFCALLPTTVTLLADINTNQNASNYEALSVGLRVEGKPASIVGITP